QDIWLEEQEGAKQQKFVVQQVSKQVTLGNKSAREVEIAKQEKEAKKEEKKKQAAELNALFKPVAELQKVAHGVDPKSKRSIYDGEGADKGAQDSMENWSQQQLEEVVNKKHGESERSLPPTTIICKHALPAGFVLKRDKKKMEEQREQISLEELIESERAALASRRPRRRGASGAERQAKASADKAKRQAEAAAGRVVGISGREMFEFRPEMGLDADDQDDDGGVAWDFRQRESEEDPEGAVVAACRFAKSAWKTYTNRTKKLASAAPPRPPRRLRSLGGCAVGGGDSNGAAAGWSSMKICSPTNEDLDELDNIDKELDTIDRNQPEVSDGNQPEVSMVTSLKYRTVTSLKYRMVTSLKYRTVTSLKYRTVTSLKYRTVTSLKYRMVTSPEASDGNQPEVSDRNQPEVSDGNQPEVSDGNHLKHRTVTSLKYRTTNSPANPSFFLLEIFANIDCATCRYRSSASSSRRHGFAWSGRPKRPPGASGWTEAPDTQAGSLCVSDEIVLIDAVRSRADMVELTSGAEIVELTSGAEIVEITSGAEIVELASGDEMVTPGSPASSVLFKGDLLVEVDGTSCAKLAYDQAVQMINGPVKIVDLAVVSGSTPLELVTSPQHFRNTSFGAESNASSTTFSECYGSPHSSAINLLHTSNPHQMRAPVNCPAGIPPTPRPAVRRPAFNGSSSSSSITASHHRPHHHHQQQQQQQQQYFTFNARPRRMSIGYHNYVKQFQQPQQQPLAHQASSSSASATWQPATDCVLQFEVLWFGFQDIFI
uniref:PDZ domain-containing protein n=1 Tax=Macrostomum lignano TaxID=282301 RepID=A0A1I8JQQ0_9PLAT